MFQPLGISHRRPSYLTVAGPPQLSAGQRSTVTAAVALLSLIGEQQRGSADTLRRLRTRAVELAVTGHGDTAQLVLTVDPGASPIPHRFQVLRARGRAEEIDETLAILERVHVVAALYGDERCAFATTKQARDVNKSLRPE